MSGQVLTEQVSRVLLVAERDLSGNRSLIWLSVMDIELRTEETVQVIAGKEDVLRVLNRARLRSRMVPGSPLNARCGSLQGSLAYASYDPGQELSVRVSINGFANVTGSGFKYQSNWSDPATWGRAGGGPLEGDDVVIPASKNVVLDVSPPPLGAVTIQGSLTFTDQVSHLAIQVCPCDPPFQCAGEVLAITFHSLDCHPETQKVADMLENYRCFYQNSIKLH